MTEIFILLSVLAAIILLIVMSIIDLKYMILPDELNLALGLCGVAFHVLTQYQYGDIQSMALGSILGAGLLYGIRFFANRHYERDTLGLGDVKLLAAAGVWLGAEGVLQSITLGALAGLIHGLVYAAIVAHQNKTRFTISNLTIPAGPGFSVGIIIVGTYMFNGYVLETFYEILP